jgi:hypothetical protein
MQQAQKYHMSDFHIDGHILSFNTPSEYDPEDNTQRIKVQQLHGDDDDTSSQSQSSEDEEDSYMDVECHEAMVSCYNKIVNARRMRTSVTVLCVCVCVCVCVCPQGA